MPIVAGSETVAVPVAAAQMGRRRGPVVVGGAVRHASAEHAGGVEDAHATEGAAGLLAAEGAAFDGGREGLRVVSKLEGGLRSLPVAPRHGGGQVLDEGAKMAAGQLAFDDAVGVAPAWVWRR